VTLGGPIVRHENKPEAGIRERCAQPEQQQSWRRRTKGGEPHQPPALRAQ